ncbi:MAG: ATP-dependent zinc metalloprotease FtsH [Oscillospiraceae bacterium]|nr:ATP-dependent zinc metalloprotease FtsH [Oscillospiraceae bacterium]MEE0719265.1 ATP-dependent zinc metalloprotease FtsH [Oscillospiraceae bacterium]CCX92652.1 aTP-dependent metalloprotease [Firmicutes bacterium CAG:110]
MDLNRNDSPNNNNNNNDGRKPGGNRPKGSIGTALLITLAIVLLVNWIYGSISKSQYTQTSFSDFLAAKDAGQLSEVEIQSDRIIYMTKEEAGKPAAMQKACYTGLPGGGDLIALSEELDAMGVKVDKKIVEDNSLIMMILSYALMIGGLFLVMNLLTKRMGGDGMMGGFGKSKAKVYMEKQTGVTFKDVAGQDEAKESLQEIIDFLHNPQKYTAIGAKLPKGALLVGSPGTGKTLLAKAVAGEANVPFFSISGSDFVEMFVGMGASRVRDLFQQAAKVAPCIIFIDEIDAVGRARDNRYGNNSEQEQTLNQLLSEIDGFEPSKGIVCLAATNRPEILDKALLRPGRFDRRIIVDKPNLQGRLDTLKVHTRKIRLSDDVDLRKIAQATAGAVGADLANLVNEAALRAVRKGRQLVNQEDLLVSFETVIAGTEKKNTVLTDMEKRLVAYHEVGHALVAALEKHSQPVSKITIVPHTSGALGYTMQMPEEEKYLSTAEELRTELRTLVGGRAAEQVVFGVQTTGAANDIQRATALARNMVTQYGMSEKFGLMSTASVENQYLDGQAYMDCSQETAAEVDKEVMEILQKAYADAKRILTENRGLLDEISEFLLVKETITGDELMAYVNADKNALPAAEEEAETPEE